MRDHRSIFVRSLRRLAEIWRLKRRAKCRRPVASTLTSLLPPPQTLAQRSGNRVWGTISPPLPRPGESVHTALNMFYSESLLSKTGPLARVWLSANLERKLSKSHILQSDIQSSVGAIVDQGQAPMALRLSGQLLLGVVRIYSRKARYLLDDCNEALMKIKMVSTMSRRPEPRANLRDSNLTNLKLCRRFD